MKIILMLCLMIYAHNSFAEGLPANPWQNPPTVNISVSEENTASPGVTSDTVDIWNKVRSSDDVRQWHMPQQTTENKEQTEKSALEKQSEMLLLLAKYRNVGYKLPNDYQNFIKNMPTRKTKSSDYSYEKTLRDWRAKYYGIKNSSLNILDNSYRRMLSTVKQTTGIDVNQTINDSINAFK